MKQIGGTKQMKRVLCINPPNAPFSEKSLLIEPIDVLSIATFAQSLGHKVKVVDMDVKQMWPEAIELIIMGFRPTVTIIPFDYHIPLHTSNAIKGINKIAQIAKEYGSRVVIAGKTAKQEPSLFLDDADVIINREVEPVLSEILKLKTWSNEELRNVKGISYLDTSSGSVKTTEKSKFVTNLDSLPIPDRSLIDLEDYIDVRTIWSSRGCSGSCSFCATPKFWCGWRARSAKHVVDEIEHLVNEFSAKKVLFLDDNATVNAKRMREISELIIQRGLNKNTNYGCLSRVTVDKETLKLMRQAGFKWIHYGAESGSQKILDKHGKRITLDQVRKSVSDTKEAGLRIRTSWIFDLPGMDEQDLQDTINFILEIEPDEIRAHYLSLRAGTEFYQKLNGKNNVNSQYVHSSKPINKLSTLSQEKILAGIEYLSEELKKRGYLVVKSMNDWKKVEELKQKSPDLKFISFCPARYGLNWEAE